MVATCKQDGQHHVTGGVHQAVKRLVSGQMRSVSATKQRRIFKHATIWEHRPAVWLTLVAEGIRPCTAAM